jgi:hypothetical protein
MINKTITYNDLSTLEPDHSNNVLVWADGSFYIGYWDKAAKVFRTNDRSGRDIIPSMRSRIYWAEMPVPE